MTDIVHRGRVQIVVLLQAFMCFVLHLCMNSYTNSKRTESIISCVSKTRRGRVTENCCIFRRSRCTSSIDFRSDMNYKLKKVYFAYLTRRPQKRTTVYLYRTRVIILGFILFKCIKCNEGKYSYVRGNFDSRISRYLLILF